jgi:hypothetical protein
MSEAAEIVGVLDGVGGTVFKDIRFWNFVGEHVD